LDDPMSGGIGGVIPEDVGRRNFRREDGAFQRVFDGDFGGLGKRRGKCGNECGARRMECGTADEKD